MGRTKEQTAESVPPTINERDVKSKARLIRQARKLSQVFGEVPSLDPEPTQAVDSLRRSNSLVSSQRSQRDYRSHSRHSTRRTTANNVESPTICSIRSFSDDNLSIISFIPSPPLSADAKLAKLNRVLGEGVPSELVFPHKADIRTARRTRRRKSLDAETFVKPSSSLQTLRKNHSMTTPKANRLARESVDFHQRYDQNFGSGSDRQRALNVKRARKMIQVFGHQPPKEIMLDPTSHLAVSVPSPLSSSMSLTSQRSSSTTTLMSLPNQEEGGRRSRRISSVAKESQRNETSTSTASNFQERRRRVAKLTRFFGVGYQDMPLYEDSCAIAGRGARVPTLLADSTSASVQVEVKLGRRLWRFMDNSDTDANMDLVLDKLRALRAA